MGAGTSEARSGGGVAGFGERRRRPRSSPTGSRPAALFSDDVMADPVGAGCRRRIQRAPSAADPDGVAADPEGVGADPEGYPDCSVHGWRREA